eukprot:TRINITY_DN107884_c0_g1_i1.p1 TRINITY_DN107884_c0_g1~~TRINITY_DN107884_c0_g1_i1.p1  ORF type:complete len:336 (+),score=76.05 TRINITY_DN107884_c0_g1_i1:44-1051(+)
MPSSTGALWTSCLDKITGGRARHQTWEASLTVEQLKAQQAESRRRARMRALGISERQASLMAAAAKAEEAAFKDQEEAEAALAGEEAQGGSDKLLPYMEQVGQAIGLSKDSDNYITSFNMGIPRPKFFCRSADIEPLPLPDADHPAIHFASPVKNVHVTLKYLGEAGTEAEPEVVWDADYANGKAVTQVSGTMPSSGGDQPNLVPPCFPEGKKHRLELRVTADDPKDPETDAESLRRDENKYLPKRKDIDEILQYEVKLLDENHPKMKAHIDAYFNGGKASGQKKDFAEELKRFKPIGPFVELASVHPLFGPTTSGSTDDPSRLSFRRRRYWSFL